MMARSEDERSRKDAAHEFRDFLIDVAKGSISTEWALERFDADELVELKKWIKKISSAFEQLEKFYICNQSNSLDFIEHGYLQLWDLMAGAFLIGSRATLSDTSVAIVKSLSGQRAGRASVAVRPEAEWKQAVTTLATDERNKCPAITKSMIRRRAEGIRGLPDTPRLIDDHIREGERNGSIPKRKKITTQRVE